jgi:hypothetical protein
MDCWACSSRLFDFSSLPFYEHLPKLGHIETVVVTGRLSTYDRQRFGRRFASFSGGENYHEYT